MKIAPLFLTRKAQKTADPILGFDESRSVQYTFENFKISFGMYFVFIHLLRKHVSYHLKLKFILKDGNIDTTATAT